MIDVDGSAWSLPPAERQRLLKNTFINHDRHRQAVAALETFHHPVVGGMADAGAIAMMLGDSRVGKSHAVERYARRFPSTAGDCGLISPIILAEMPAECTVRAVLSSLASALGMHHSARMSNPALLELVLSSLKAQRVELLVLDESHQLFNGGDKRMVVFGRNLLRRIANLRSLNVICVGLPETHPIIAADEQLTGRGGLAYTLLQPYTWDSKDEQDAFRLLCSKFDDLAPFEHRSDLHEVSTAYALYQASHGVIGRLKDIVFYAGCRAINDGSPCIERRHFAIAYDERKPLNSVYNPFRESPRSLPAGSLPGSRPREGTPGEIFAKSSGRQKLKVGTEQ